MNEVQLLCYNHKILLPQIGLDGQQKLAQSKVLIIGLGGLGSPVAMYLAAAGLGHLVLVDFDFMELSNLQRQIMHDTAQLGQYKLESARTKLQVLNPNTRVTLFNQCLEKTSLETLIKDIDVVVDCSDNFATRFTINAVCVHSGTPLVSGAALRWSGQVAVFLPASPESPCYHCLYDESQEQTETCSEAGILAPVVGAIGSIQATCVIKVLLDIGESLCGKLLLFDAHKENWRTLKLPKDPTCFVCSPNSLGTANK